MKGYFGIGAYGISKTFNIGNLFRSAHAFDASFVFTVDAQYNRKDGHVSDTSDSLGQLPFYDFKSEEDLILPDKCTLVGIELTDDAIALPTFRHPPQAAYILGPERGILSPKLQKKCKYIIQIPTKFCLNVGIAGAIVMYDRLLTMGRFAERPVRAGGPTEELIKHRHGKAIYKRMDAFKANPPLCQGEDE